MGLFDFFTKKKDDPGTIRCPKCNTKLDRERDRHGKAEHHEVMGVMGIPHVRIKCPKCGAVMDVTG